MSRYLCSELVAVYTNNGESVVNLEEIWTTGAVLECEDPMEAGSSIEVKGGAVRFHGTVTNVELHDFGCRVEVEFSPLTPWNLESFTPQHLVDVSGVPGSLFPSP